MSVIGIWIVCHLKGTIVFILPYIIQEIYGQIICPAKLLMFNLFINNICYSLYSIGHNALFAISLRWIRSKKQVKYKLRLSRIYIKIKLFGRKIFIAWSFSMFRKCNTVINSIFNKKTTKTPKIWMVFPGQNHE